MRITERHDNPRVAELLVDGLNVLDIRPLNPVHAKGILILGLKCNHWAAIGNLSIRDDSANVRNIVLRCFEVTALVGP